jgi:hypothetical protein
MPPTKTISGRKLRHETPEEDLAPGETVRIEKRGGKVFDLTRVDACGVDVLDGLDRILEEIPRTGPAEPVDMASIIIEDRE